MKSILLISLIVGVCFSRLLLPSMLQQAFERGKRHMNHHLKTHQSPETASSSAAPVEGIANATSGYLSVNDPNTNSKLFYIFYSCRNLPAGQNPEDVPIIIWLQGGPGGSSLIGNFYEMGAWQLGPDGNGEIHEIPRENSWNDYFNLLIVDNPRGTGYSIADKNSYLTTETEIANDFLQALFNFYGLSAFAQYKNTPLYIFGESYAGHYIPSIASRIVESNQESPEVVIPLKGVGIGDGWTDPINQLPLNDIFGYSLGLLDDVERAKVVAYQANGAYNVNNENWEAAIGDFNNIMNAITSGGGGLNVYNFRDFGNYDFSDADTFMNYKSTCTRYNVDPSVCGTYTDESNAVYEALTTDFMQSVAPKVAYLLENNLPVMLYNGQDDIICNSPNQQNWVGNLNWTHQTDFYNTEFNVWVYENQTMAGLMKQNSGLTFVVVNKAGHLSPMDQINTTTEMVRRFIAGDTNWTNPFSYYDLYN